MAKSKSGPPPKRGDDRGPAGEPHQHSATPLTTNQGTPIADDQNTLKAGVRGPSLLEDFHFLEKITHFDHERIPERIVHARGSAAHGTFVASKGAAKYTQAAFLQPGVETPVFTRFSTVAGGAGSVDTPRDVRGFAVKFYTQQGNFDLVGNNIPVFFIQDAIKFPDFVHSVKMEPDRGFPQNASAHDTFWDFISLAPEALHMVMWAMSDRAIPRSLRMMEGFGVHTFRLIDAKGASTFIKWHWRPALGTQSTTWDEAVKLAGADQDFHRRDLWEAITNGAFPAWELLIQPIPADEADGLPYDILDPTKLVPEEEFPLISIGPDHFFAETEQVAFHPGHLVPGIEFSSDPLLQGRIFSYTDTQLKRLGGPNFHELEINRPKCPMHNFQRDGMARIQVDRGRTNYEPNSIEPNGPRETPAGFTSYPEPLAGTKIRQRSETFGDHHSQARLFYRSQTAVEQRHIANAFTFELSKVEAKPIRTRVLGHLEIIDKGLATTVAEKLGMAGQADAITPVREPIDMEPSPALSILGKAPATLAGRKVGILIADGCDAALLDKLRAAIEKAGATVQLVAPKVGETKAAGGKALAADHQVQGGPSVIFDACAIVVGEEGIDTLVANPAAVQWAADAFNHCKVIGAVAAAQPLLDKANVKPDAGVLDLAGKGVDQFVARAKRGRIWAREEQAEVPPPAKPKAKKR